MTLVIREPGHPDEVWHSAAPGFWEWLKGEIKPRLVSAAQAEAGFSLTDFLGEQASLGRRDPDGCIVLERFH